jgi:hypothetical protein
MDGRRAASRPCRFEGKEHFKVDADASRFRAVPMIRIQIRRQCIGFDRIKLSKAPPNAFLSTLSRFVGGLAALVYEAFLRYSR